jgi:glycosyltransferase involved in cell wall biosynthesis
VQIEFMELAGLIESRAGDARWVLDLHDVYLDGGPYDVGQRELMAQFDTLLVCSPEDAALLAHPRVELVANGAADRLAGYAPSQGAHVLFMGPFRYRPNRDGIEAFLRDAWPRVRAAVPEATLTILGGPESKSAAIEPLFAQPGVELVSAFVDPAPHLSRAALTINPQLEIRGSALKLIESLLAGRVCVSTSNGARGFADSGLAGLVTVGSIEKLGEEVAALLRDDARRRAIERPEAEAIRKYTWDGIAAKLLATYA